MKATNFVCLRGGIVRIRTSKSIASITLATDGNSGKLSSFPNIVTYDPTMFENFKIGERVTVEAHIQLHPIYNNERKIVKFETSIVCDHIERNKRPLAAYLDNPQEYDLYDGGSLEDKNYAIIFGKVGRIYVPHDRITLLSIMVPSKRTKGVDQCEVACFKRQAEVGKMLERGDYVMVYGSVRTKSEQDEKGNMITNQHVICKDILKVNHLDGFEE